MKDVQINIRLSKDDKLKCEQVIKDINKTSYNKIGYRFLIMEYVNNYLNNNVKGLQIELNNLKKENDKDKEKIKELNERITQREIKIKEYGHEINNKNLYHEKNFNDPNIIKAIGSIKEIILNNGYKEYEELPEEIYIQMKTTFNINNENDLKNIVKYNFERWKQQNLNNNETQEKTYNEKLNQIIKMFNRRFNSNKATYNNDKIKCLQDNEMIYKKACKQNNIIYDDFINKIKESK